MPRRLIAHPLIFCFTFSQAAQAYTQDWLTHPVRTDTWRTDTIGSSLSGDSISITQGERSGLTVNATGDIIVDIPEVPKEAPAPAEEPIPTKGPDGRRGSEVGKIHDQSSLTKSDPIDS